MGETPQWVRDSWERAAEEARQHGWPYGDEAAARFVAAAAWPWERTENREGWAPKMLTDRDMAERTIPKARENLEAAIRALTDHLDPARPADTTCRVGDEGSES